MTFWEATDMQHIKKPTIYNSAPRCYMHGTLYLVSHLSSAKSDYQTCLASTHVHHLITIHSKIVSYHSHMQFFLTIHKCCAIGFGKSGSLGSSDVFAWKQVT